MTRMYIFNHNEVEESQNVMILTAMTIIKFRRASQYISNPNETAQYIHKWWSWWLKDCNADDGNDDFKQNVTIHFDSQWNSSKVMPLFTMMVVMLCRNATSYKIEQHKYKPCPKKHQKCEKIHHILVGLYFVFWFTDGIMFLFHHLFSSRSISAHIHCSLKFYNIKKSIWN